MDIQDQIKAALQTVRDTEAKANDNLDDMGALAAFNAAVDAFHAVVKGNAWVIRDMSMQGHYLSEIIDGKAFIVNPYAHRAFIFYSQERAEDACESVQDAWPNDNFTVEVL